MDFELSEDQSALQEAARDLLAHHASPARVRAVVDEATGFDPRLWSAMVEQGWLALSVPEDRGGLGLGVVELAVLCEQLGAACAPGPFAQQAMALDALVRAHRDGRGWAGDWVEAVAAGEASATVAWRAVQALGASDDEDRTALQGRTEPAIGAPTAQVAVVAAREPDPPDGQPPGGDGPVGGSAGHGLYLVEVGDRERPGAEPAMDRTRSLGWLHLEGTRARRLGGADAVARFWDLGATLTAADLLGGAQRALDMSVAYAKEREQFNKPIGSFQAVKHRCADMLVDVEGMRSSAYYAAWALGADDPDASLAASTAKAWCADASARVLASALQVHGGIGFTWEHDLHVVAKRGHLEQVSFGDATHHRRRLAAMLARRLGAGEPVV